MAWVKIDDKVTGHPKIRKAGPMAAWLWVCGLAYASRYLTDGFLPNSEIRLLGVEKGAPKLAEKLVAVGLWEQVEGGYQIHDYHDYQPSAQQIKAEQEAARLRKRRPLGEADESGRIPAGFRPEPHARAHAGASRPVPSRPVPSEETAGGGSTGVTGGAGGAPTAAAVGQAADAAVAPEEKPAGKRSRGTKALGVNLGPLVDAFTALGLPKPPLTGPEVSAAQTLLKHYEPYEIARCWADIASRAYGDDYDRRHLSLTHLAAMNRLGNWQRERGDAAPVVQGLVRDIVVERV